MTATTEKLEANKKLARDYIDQVFNQHNPDKAADFVTDNVIWHGGGLGDIAGPENLAALLGSFIGALPDLHAAEQDIIAENDLVVVRPPG
jgi:predicted SnoaL-like aldol condensation-catalyzing enzyme